MEDRTIPTNYDAIDLEFSYNGDYTVGIDGDLGDTALDQIQSLVQEVRSVVASAIGDWQEHPQRAASLDDFVGEPNTRQTAKEIEKRIRDSLVVNEVVEDRDLQIRVVPIGPHQLFIALNIDALATDNNSIETNGVQTTLIFDWLERGVFFIDRVE